MLRTGELSPGERIPSEREFEERFNISRPTINKVLTRLVAEGALRRDGGRRGTYVARLPDVADMARKLSRVSKLVKFVVPGRRYQSPITHGILEGMYDVASGEGYHAGVDFLGWGQRWYEKVVEGDNGRCAGLVIWYQPGTTEREALEAIRRAGVPFVLVDAYPTDMDDLDFVVTDNIDGAHQMVDHLVSLGHRRICYVTDTVDRTSTRDRQTGFLRGLVDNGLSLNDSNVIVIHEEKGETVHDAVKRVLDRQPPATAIFASHDAIAIQVAESLHQWGVQYPQTLSLVGYDDIDHASVMPVPLTTVRQDFYQMGKIATEILLEKAQGRGSSRPHRLFLKAQLVVRQSAGPVQTTAASQIR